MRKILLLMMFLLCCMAVLADDPEYFYEVGEPIDLKVPCIYNNTACSDNAECNMTIFYENSSLYVADAAMTNNNIYFNYTMQNTNTTNKYQSTVVCCDNGACAYSTFYYDINTTGNETNRSIVAALVFFIVLIAVSLSLTIFFSVKESSLKYMFLLLTFIFMTVAAYIVYQYSMELSVSYGNMFYVGFWVCLILTFIMVLIVFVELTINILAWLANRKKKDYPDNI